MEALENINIQKLTLSVYGPDYPDHPDYTVNIDTLDNEDFFEGPYFHQSSYSSLEHSLNYIKKWCHDKGITQIPIVRVYIKSPNMSFSVDLNPSPFKRIQYA